MIPLETVKTEESPRSVIATHGTSPEGELPIGGGWGYTRNDACVIERVDSAADPKAPGDRVSIEQLFVEKRIIEEMIHCRPEGERFAGIEWSMLTQEHLNDATRQFDKLTFEIRAFPERDWESLKAEYGGPRGVANPKFNHEDHEKKRQKKLFFVTREFWFDVTAFLDQEPVMKSH